MTASIGVATSQSNGVTDARALEELADKMMYRAKERKNAIAVAE